MLDGFFILRTHYIQSCILLLLLLRLRIDRHAALLLSVIAKHLLLSRLPAVYDRGVLLGGTLLTVQRLVLQLERLLKVILTVLIIVLKTLALILVSKFSLEFTLESSKLHFLTCIR